VTLRYEPPFRVLANEVYYLKVIALLSPGQVKKRDSPWLLQFGLIGITYAVPVKIFPDQLPHDL